MRGPSGGKGDESDGGEGWKSGPSGTSNVCQTPGVDSEGPGETGENGPFDNTMGHVD